VYQGETFYRLWQELSNVSAGIHGGQPAWFVGPSLQRAKRWAAEFIALMSAIDRGLAPLEPAAPGNWHVRERNLRASRPFAPQPSRSWRLQPGSAVVRRHMGKR